MKKTLALAAFTALSPQAFAVITAKGIIAKKAATTSVWDTAALTREVGQAIDDTYTGRITIQFDMTVTAASSDYFALFLLMDGGIENLGMGSKWASGRWNTWNEAGTGGDENSSGSQAVVIGTAATFTLVIDYHAGADDVATLTGPGLSGAVLTKGDYSFDAVNFRKGEDGTVGITNISLAVTGEPEAAPEAILGLGGVTLILRRRK